MNIAPATLDDALGIAAVHVRSWQAAYAGILKPEFLDFLSLERRAEQWCDILQQQESQTLVAHEPAGITGFVSSGRWRDESATVSQGEIWALYVQPEEWSKGLGQALLNAAIQELRAAGRHTVFLWVLSENSRGVRFYQSFGFEPVQGSAKLFQIGGSEVEEVCLRLQHDA